MAFKKILEQLDIFAQCKKYHISLWQCPQFLFVLMGLVIITTIVASYLITALYITNPQIVILIIFVLTAILFIIAFIINSSFERLAEANRMKSEFVGIVSHQLRAPLTNLKYIMEFLISDKTIKKQSEYFKIIQENNERMNELINDLLIVSRIEQGKIFVNKEKVNIKDLIEKLISRFKTFTNAINAEITFKAQENLPMVFVDSSQIKLVIENLLDNAVRYISNKSEKKVEIKLSKTGKNLFFEIKDSGVGIPKQDQKYIFQRFFRSKNVMKNQTQGTGLGLYIAKGIIEKLGGKIGFKSKEEKGSTFWFTLPIK
ncbi:HAMP domain-containing histidine kinase [Candidatus Parcubacteria bacterium]|nr:HAMP domain-containing histidine kinase [Candidatus Parcubacteria bacterium]